MTIAHLFEDFTASALGEPMQLLSEEALEDERLAAFERGYSAGWEDALAAQADDKAKLSEALRANLQDLSFTYHDALAQMNANLRPLLDTMIGAVLPGAMAASFGHHIVDQLQQLAREQIEQPMSVVVPSGCREPVLALLEQSVPTRVDVSEDDRLEADQAWLRVGDHELELDGGALLEEIRAAVEAFNFQTAKDNANG